MMLCNFVIVDWTTFKQLKNECVYIIWPHFIFNSFTSEEPVRNLFRVIVLKYTFVPPCTHLPAGGKNANFNGANLFWSQGLQY